MPKTRRLDYRRLNWNQVFLPSLKLLSALPSQFCQQSPHPLPTQVQVLFWFCLDWPPQGQVSRNILAHQMCGFNLFQFLNETHCIKFREGISILMLLLQMSSWKMVSPRGERLVESEDNLKYFCQISAAYRSVRSSQSHVCHFCHPCNFCHISQVCHMQITLI